MVGSVIWLESPEKYDYLRASFILRSSKRISTRNEYWKRKIPNFWKLFGYRFEYKTYGGVYVFTIFWLKDYDRGAPNQDECYTYGRPSESIRVSKLLEGEK